MTSSYIIKTKLIKFLWVYQEMMINFSKNSSIIDVQAMVAMAIRCLSQSPSGSSLSSSKQRRLGDYLEQPLRLIAAQQDPDGSFDHNLATTALAIQALTMITSLNQSNPTGMDSIPWRLDSALDWIRSMQRSDGSFAGDIFTTTEVLLALSGRGYGTLGGRCTPPPLFPIEKYCISS